MYSTSMFNCVSRKIQSNYYLIGIYVFFLLYLSITSSKAQEQIELAKGTTMRVVAPLSTNQQILGVAFDKNFNSIDATGNKFNAFPKGKIITTKNFEYRASYKEIEDVSQMNASVGFSKLFSISAQKIKKTRYAILSVYCIKKTETFQPEGLPTISADFYAHQIHYGWAVHYIINEDISKFNSETSSKITKFLIGSGGDLNYTIQDLKLNSEMLVRGLQPKQAGSIVLNPKDIASTFVQVGKESPIFIEFKTLTNVPVEAISWEGPKFTPGRYILESIDYKINQKKSNGSNWDINLVGSTDPDALIVVKVNGNILDKIGGNTNSLNGTTTVSKTIEINEQTIINIEVYDKDGASGDDFVGTATITFNDLSKENVEYPITILNKTGKIDDLKIRLKISK